ncbi:hypothetical protein [Streptomyces chartreusis]|uniref:hypothetical protein n=1 Tax=Streptomyces chartreusis TaxID=1969 RepID=UPI0033A9539C
MRSPIAAALAALVAVGGLTLTSCTTDNGGGSSPAPSETKTQTPSPEQSKQQESPQGGQKENNERKDLISFKLDDRSQAGFEDIWVTWTIKNHSSEKSDYSWDWEAVDSSGTRVANSTEYVDNVQPGQTTTGEDITTLKTANVKINVTEFERTKAY